MVNEPIGVSGPFVKAAFLCDTVIEGKDGTSSYIRVVDRLGIQGRRVVIGQIPPGVQPPALPESLPEGSMVSTWLVIMVAGGGALGRHALMLRMRGPDGLFHELAGPFDVLFDARPSSGVNLHMHLDLAFTQEGPYEIHALLDGNDFARVFFEVVYQRV